MTPYTNWTHLCAILLSAALEVAANIMLAKSDGFKRRLYAWGALFFVALAFTFLAYAVRGLDLAVAYALWGAFGILGTSAGGWILFGQRLRPSAWLGVIMLISGIVVLQLA